MIDLKNILDDHGTNREKQRRLRRFARAYDRMKSTLRILHTWCRHDARRTTHEQIIGLIDEALTDVAEMEDK